MKSSILSSEDKQDIREIYKHYAKVAAMRAARLVTARIILLAGFSHFMANPRASFRQVRDTVGFRGGSFLKRWIDALPLHALSSLC